VEVIRNRDKNMTTTKKTKNGVKPSKKQTRTKTPPPKKHKIERWIILPDLHSSANTMQTGSALLNSSWYPNAGRLSHFAFSIIGCIAITTTRREPCNDSTEGFFMDILLMSKSIPPTVTPLKTL
jgi:hypothetical protein